MENVSKKRNIFAGIVGALIGALIGSVPWILAYIYIDTMWSILAAVIGIGAYYGYKLFKGPLNKHTPVIVTVISLLVMAVVIMLVIPIILMMKYNDPVSFSELFNGGEYIRGIVSESYFSILFTFVGIAAIIALIKKDVGV